jgi:hypothetical protein
MTKNSGFNCDSPLQQKIKFSSFITIAAFATPEELLLQKLSK